MDDAKSQVEEETQPKEPQNSEAASSAPVEPQFFKIPAEGDGSCLCE